MELNATARDLATYVEAMIGGELLSTDLQAVRLDSLGYPVAVFTLQRRHQLGRR